MVQYPAQTEIKLSGNQAQQLKQVEAALNKFRLRLQRKIVAIIPPIPIFMYNRNPENGVVCTFILPLSGTIQAMYVNIGNLPREGVVLSVIIRSGSIETTSEVICSRTTTSTQLDTRAHSGTVVEVRASGGGDFALGFLLQPDRQSVRTEHHLLENVLALEGADNGSD